MGLDNVIAPLCGIAGSDPERKAVIDATTGESWNYRELAARTDRYALGLHRLGIGRGTKTVFLVSPSADSIAILFALFRLAAIPVVIDPGMGLAGMLRCIASTNSEAFIGVPKAHLLRFLRPRCFRTIQVTVTAGMPWFWGGPRIDEFRDAPGDDLPIAETSPDDRIAIFFTTGSTGPAKGVEYTRGMFEGIVALLQENLDVRPGDADLATFPLFGPLGVLAGGTTIIPDMDPTKPARANPEKIAGHIDAWKAVSMFASPALLDQVARYGQRSGIRLRSLKRVISGGAPVSVRIVEGFSALLEPTAELHVTYGATEALPIASITAREILGETRAGSQSGLGTCVGRPFACLSVRVIRITDEPIPAWSESLVKPTGTVGEIVVKGPHVSRRYFERPDADTEGKIAEGTDVWHRTGDLGWLDDRGRIWFCGRKKHRVLTESGPLYSVCAEGVFNAHPQVFRSALVGIGAPSRQRPVICIELFPKARGIDRPRLKRELLDLSGRHEATAPIRDLLFHPGFPVDIRHNAKIFREKLVPWASRRL